MQRLRVPLAVGIAAGLAALAVYSAVAASLPFYDKGEPREALVVRGLLRGGGVVLPTSEAIPMPAKPPLFHWLAAAAVRAGVRPEELAMRMPSVVLGAAVVGATATVAAEALGPATGVVTAAMLGSSFEWMRAATQSRVDMTLAALIVVAIACWGRVVVDDGRALARAGWAAVGLAVLTKGPVGFVLPALAAVAIACASGRARALARLARPGDVLACAALVVAWYAAAWRVGGAGFTDRQIVQENVQRFVGWGRVPHRHGVLYYVPALAGGLLPWTPLLVFVRRPGGRSGWPPARVLVAWIVAVLGFYSLAAGKRSVYLLPLYPPLAVLLAAGVVPALQRARDDGPGRAALAAVGALGVLAFAVVAGALDPLLVGIGPLLGGSDAFRLPAVRAVVDQNRALLGIVVAGGAAGLFLWASAGRRVRVALLGGAALAWCALLTVLGTLPVAAETSPRDAARSLRRLVPRDAPICARGPVEYGFRYYADVPLARCGEGTGRDPAATELDVVPDATSGHVHYFVRIAGGAATALDGEERAR